MDGTMIDNNPFHFQAWQRLCREHGRDLSPEEYTRVLSGKNNRDTLRYLFGGVLEQQELESFLREKERYYQQIYAPHIAPIRGLPGFLARLASLNIPMAVASSATLDNIRFAFQYLPLRSYFQAVVDSTQVSRGKPDPEIFLRAALCLNRPAQRCLVFEDSLNGIKGARAAGMKVVALSTAHSPSELELADRVISDYQGLDPEELVALLDG